MNWVMKVPPECQSQDKGDTERQATWASPSTRVLTLWSYLVLMTSSISLGNHLFFIFNYSFGGGRGGRVLLFLSFKIQIFTAFKMHFLPSHFNIYKVKMYLTGGMYFNLVGFISSSEKLLSNKWWLIINAIYKLRKYSNCFLCCCTLPGSGYYKEI